MTETQSTLRVTRYDPATMEDAFRALLGRWGVLDPSSPFFDYWQPILKDFREVLDDLFMACDGDAVIGLAQINWRPTLDDKARSVTYFIDHEQPKEQVALALKQYLDPVLAKRGITKQVAFSAPEYADYNAFYEQIGFVHRPEYDSMRMIWDGGDYTAPAISGLEIHHYDRDHPDPKIESELAELFNRTFANEPSCSALSAADIRKLAICNNMWFAYARETATGKIVSYAECGDGGLFSAISVIRPYWGKGVAEWLAAHCMDHFRATGTDKLWSLVRIRNAPSIRLHKRMGWQHDGGGIYKYLVADINQP